MQDNYNIFKRQLKTHYFRIAYNFYCNIGVHKFYSLFLILMKQIYLICVVIIFNRLGVNKSIRDSFVLFFFQDIFM